MSEKEEEPKRRRRRIRPVIIAGGSRFVREKLQGKTFLVPSFITVVGIFCGFLAIISSINGRFEYATKCIALAIILDGLDGRVARRLNATSAFGREFDSLSDLVAFGVAPAVLTYCWAFNPLADEFGVLVAFVFVVCGATRLARFNVAQDGESSKGSFTGLPIPGAAVGIASIVYCFPERVESQAMVVIMLFFLLLLAVLMVSTLPFFSVKNVRLSLANPRVNLLLLSALVALTWKYSRVLILIGSVGYSVSGLLGYLMRKFLPQTYERGRKAVGMGEK